jgi:hypothetical protein
MPDLPRESRSVGDFEPSTCWRAPTGGLRGVRSGVTPRGQVGHDIAHDARESFTERESGRVAGRQCRLKDVLDDNPQC